MDIGKKSFKVPQNADFRLICRSPLVTWTTCRVLKHNETTIYIVNAKNQIKQIW